MEFSPHQLHPTADADELSAPLDVADQALVESAAAQGGEIPQRLFAPWHDHGIRLAQFFSG